MTSISVAKLLFSVRELPCRRFPSNSGRAGRRRGHTVILRLGFSISSQRIHLRGSKVSCSASGCMTLQALAIIAYVVLVGYCLSYIIAGALTPFHFVKYRRLGVLLDALVTLAVLLSLGYAIFLGTRFAIDEIARGHVASRSIAPHSSPGP